jgi:hypothetical protein
VKAAIFRESRGIDFGPLKVRAAVYAIMELNYTPLLCRVFIERVGAATQTLARAQTDSM